MRAALAVLLWLVAWPAWAQDATLQARIDETMAAFAANDAAAALTSAAETEALARQTDTATPEQYAFALSNLGYALMLTGETPDRARALFGEAKAHLEAAGDSGSAAWITITGNLAVLETGQGNRAAAEGWITDVVRAARGTPQASATLSGASTLLFQLGAIPAAVDHLRELLATDPAALSTSYGTLYTAYFEAQEQAEAEGRLADVEALVEARIAILKAFPPPDVDLPALERTLRYQVFAASLQAEVYGRAADALRAWSAVGTPTDDELASIEALANGFLTLSQFSAYSGTRATQLGQADLALAMAEALPDPQDPRRGLALRELAAAEDSLGRYAEAAAALYRAADLLAQTEAGRQSLHLVLHDLGSNAWKTGDIGRARDLYDRADAAYAAALASGATPLTGMDLVISTINRANVEIDLGRPETALALLDAAAETFDAENAARALKWNDHVQRARLDTVAARALEAAGRPAAALARMDHGIAAARTAFPPDHRDFALMLNNSADLYAIAGANDRARALSTEAVAILTRILPHGDPQLLDSAEKLALTEVLAGDRASALDRLRRIAEGRQRPANRGGLAAARDTFEILAWLLLDGRPDRAATDEAFQALQWTQVTRSAEAIALTEARLAHAAAGLGGLLRQRQDLLETHRRVTSLVTAAYAEGADPGGALLSAANGRLAEIDRNLTRIDRDLAAAGTDAEALGQVRPMSLAEVQAALGPGETLVTFALSGLTPGVIPGLAASSNKAIAVTRDTVTVAAVAEDHRGDLRRRIRAFRCAVAVSDPGCGAAGGAAGLRGALMLDQDLDPDPYFDRAAAEALYADLFGGLGDVLSRTDLLLIAPPAELIDLPFQALVTGPGGTDLAAMPWMIRDHAISLLPSVAALRALGAPAPAGGKMLGVGDPVIGLADALDCATLELAALRSVSPGVSVMAEAAETGLRLADPAALRRLSRLPDAACELQAIASRFGPNDSTLLLADAAQEAEVKRLSQAGQLAAYDVLVFATHGLVAGEAGAAAPGLVLTPPAVATAADDGLLTAAEIARLDLNARLVVLSACNTAAGDGAGTEGLSGLARAFLHAGAQAVMVTQWAVYSEAAVEISSGLFATGEDARGARALRAAMLAVLDAEGSDAFKRHPAYWAPFTMVGAG